MNIFEGLKKYSSLKKGEVDFVVCSRDGKYGLLNKYLYLCLPYEYDKIELEYEKSLSKGVSRQTLFAKLEKDGTKFTAIINGDSVCNILTCQPKSMILCKQFIIIEEEYTKGGNTYTKRGLMNRGGVRILESEYDSIDIVSDHFAIVSKENLMELFFICQINCERRLGPSKVIKYGEGYNSSTSQKYYYTTDDECDILKLGVEDENGFHQECHLNWVFDPEDLESDEENRARSYDKIYFSYHNKPNNYFAVVIGDKTKLVDLNGEEVFPLVIPSDCHVLTDTLSDNVVGISKIVKEVDSDGKEHEKRCYSYINSDGKILTDFIYDGIEKFENGQARAYYDLPSSRTEHILDRDGKIIFHHSDYAESEPQECNWEEWRDDTFEGDPEAYWNTD